MVARPMAVRARISPESAAAWKCSFQSSLRGLKSRTIVPVSESGSRHVCRFIEVARATRQCQFRYHPLLPGSSRNNVFNLKRKVEDHLRRVAILATVAGSPSYFGVSRVHRPSSSARVAARCPAARTSVSISNSSSVCSPSGKPLPCCWASDRYSSSVPPGVLCCSAAQKRSGRKPWTTTNVPSCSSDNCAEIASRASPRVLPSDDLPPDTAWNEGCPSSPGTGKMATVIFFPSFYQRHCSIDKVSSQASIMRADSRGMSDSSEPKPGLFVINRRTRHDSASRQSRQVRYSRTFRRFALGKDGLKRGRKKCAKRLARYYPRNASFRRDNFVRFRRRAKRHRVHFAHLTFRAEFLRRFFDLRRIRVL